ncbi:MAG: hypothetical protein ACXAC7_01865 [Candidatus Hodarchaeales archaeon]
MVKVKTFLFLSYLKKFKVYDTDNVLLGQVGDILVNKSDLLPHSLILYGSFLEEKLEDIGIREDIDPIVSVNDISEIDNKEKIIRILKPRTEISTTDNNWQPPDDLYQFSKLKKIPVFNKRDKNIGSIIDIVLYSGKSYSLVINGNFLVPKGIIKEISLKKIKTTVFNKKELEGIKQFIIKHQITQKSLIKDYTLDKLIMESQFSASFSSIGFGF